MYRYTEAYYFRYVSVLVGQERKSDLQSGSNHDSISLPHLPFLSTISSVVGERKEVLKTPFSAFKNPNPLYHLSLT